MILPFSRPTTRLPLFAGTLVLLPALSSGPPETVPKVYERYNAGDFAGMFALYADHVVFEDPTLDMRVEGRDALQRQFGLPPDRRAALERLRDMIRAAAPDAKELMKLFARRAEAPSGPLRRRARSARGVRRRVPRRPGRTGHQELHPLPVS